MCMCACVKVQVITPFLNRFETGVWRCYEVVLLEMPLLV